MFSECMAESSVTACDKHSLPSHLQRRAQYSETLLQRKGTNVKYLKDGARQKKVQTFHATLHNHYR